MLASHPFLAAIGLLWIGLLIVPASDAAAERVNFDRDVRPILTQHCSSCHGGVKQAADLSFVSPADVLPPSGWVVEPGDPEASLLIERILSDDPDERMPPPDEHPEPVPVEQIETLVRWVREGARWAGPWAIQPLVDSVAPASSDRVNRPLDHFVLDRLRKAGLSFSAPAAPETWLRRVSFDLIGIPPTPTQLEQFVSRCGKTSDASSRQRVYAREVDRLLSDPRFGERWASVWMDLARYADSMGFEKDPHRNMWPYRDWLIRVFNSDMPYDEFTIKQLAGDLLPGPNTDDLIATAFHRNTQTNTEGGTDDEEFRVAAVIDRINTTWTVWQATTMGCVQCHAHPYDPLQHQDYYRSMAIWNNTYDADLSDDWPTLSIPANAESLEEATAVQWQHQQSRHQLNRMGSDVAATASWRPMAPVSVHTTGGRLAIDDDWVRTDGGTFPVGVKYTAGYRSPTASLTALRIEIRPQDRDVSDWPQEGGVLSELKIELVTEGQEPSTVTPTTVFADAITGASDPEQSLHKGRDGVGEFPKLNRPREAYFVFDPPLSIGPDQQLRLSMTQSQSKPGNVALPLRNFRWSATEDATWTTLLQSDRYQSALAQRDQLKRQANQVKGVALPIAMRRPDEAARSTHLFIRGNWQEHGPEAMPGLPGVFDASGIGTGKVRDRLEFARWLVSDANPLAARVWANRVWAQLFGVGLVETLEDFGGSGQQPSHPRLLDHLASRMRDDHRWSLKATLRQWVLSTVYQQTGDASPESRESDPANRWLARGPRTRLTAEMVRDQALAVSGLIENRQGGQSVMPPQPDGVWQTVYSGAKWETAEGANRYRRGLYTYWRRTSPYPSFLTFDSPTRDLCVARRIPTNTPMQALVTLNDPVYVESAAALAKRAAELHDGDRDQTIAWIFRAATSQTPRDREWSLLRDLFNDLEQETGSAAAAMELVAGAILNLDKAMTK
ncbi:MAG: PSD1 and planctomycete cytochrome C domain-containing protein [Planctomycetota bacterium]